MPIIAVHNELFGFHPPLDGVMQVRRAEVLRHRQDVASGIAEVAHGGFHLVNRFTHPKDQV